MMSNGDPRFVQNNNRVSRLVWRFSNQFLVLLDLRWQFKMFPFVSMGGCPCRLLNTLKRITSMLLTSLLYKLRLLVKHELLDEILKLAGKHILEAKLSRPRYHSQASSIDDQGSIDDSNKCRFQHNCSYLSNDRLYVSNKCLQIVHIVVVHLYVSYTTHVRFCYHQSVALNLIGMLPMFWASQFNTHFPKVASLDTESTQSQSPTKSFKVCFGVHAGARGVDGGWGFFSVCVRYKFSTTGSWVPASPALSTLPITKSLLFACFWTTWAM